ncbi:hypothetical protein [Natronolimnohabitans innermongolicus]|uniref:DUF8106 domain-containing protein n=1 Tax=Natronolimnohabitans innermongolicus JCM 12255 TaxID=1227499 RepID=L9X6W8_9EURY|nr:hypothetical protein [Natronolimnohabitans innermongolicus]ELY57455.1 hypothetical protein C493_08216 [Natronolimnohabitans innermongolicus JCM 12255]
MTSPNPDSRPSDRSKTRLYCYECGHESHISGDWCHRRTDDGVTYDCPDCGTTITTRPASDARDRPATGSRCYGLGD